MLQRLTTALGRASGASSSDAKLPAIGLVIFLTVACYWCVLGFPLGVEYLSGDQYLNLLLVLKAEHPSLFSQDLVFDGPDLTQEYIPFYIYFLRAAYRWTGDLAAGYKLMIFPLTLIYLAGAYLLFRRLGGAIGVAIALALLSSLPYRVPFATDLFGLGPIGFMLARSFYTAATPWVFLAFAAWLDRPARLLSLFLAIGLLANLHPVSGLFVGPVLALVYVLEQRCAPRAWAVAVLAGIAVVLGALPIVSSQLHVVGRQPVASASFRAGVAEVLQQNMRVFLYPPYTMGAAPRWLVDALTLAIGVTSIALVFWWLQRGGPWLRLPVRLVTVGALAYILYPTAILLVLLLVLLASAPQRESVDRHERLAVLFALSIFWASVGGLVVFQTFFDVFERPVFFVIANRSMRYAIFAAYLLVPIFLRTADWARLAGWWRTVDAHVFNRWIRTLCVGLLIAAFFWQLRGNVRNTIRAREAVELADLAAVAQWARESTDAKAAFLFDSPAFRVLARRSLAFTSKDVDAVASHRPDRAAMWAERRSVLRQAGSNPAALWEAGVRFGADYVVVPAGQPLEGALAGRVQYENLTYVVLTTDRARSRRVTAPKTAGGT
jgi:hypothetical protein